MMKGLAILLLSIHDIEGMKSIYFDNAKTFSRVENMYSELVKTCVNYCDSPGNELLKILNKAAEEGTILSGLLEKLYKNLQENVNYEIPNIYY
jgi:uncharacterized protein YuzB (UPF0349 family)